MPGPDGFDPCCGLRFEGRFEPHWLTSHQLRTHDKHESQNRLVFCTPPDSHPTKPGFVGLNGVLHGGPELIDRRARIPIHRKQVREAVIGSMRHRSSSRVKETTQVAHHTFEESSVFPDTGHRLSVGKRPRKHVEEACVHCGGNRKDACLHCSTVYRSAVQESVYSIFPS